MCTVAGMTPTVATTTAPTGTTGGGPVAPPADLATAVAGLAAAVQQLAAAVQALAGAGSLATAGGGQLPQAPPSAVPSAPDTPAGTAPTTAPPAAAPTTGAQPPAPPTTTGGGATTGASQAKAGVLLIGDSLTVGTKQYMPKQIDGAPVTVDATGGIPLAEGMRRYDAVKQKPRVVEMALFTNNSPGQQEELRKAIQKTVDDARARGGRVVWATIVRPGNYDGVNAMIREMATKNADVMGLVDWAKMVQQHPDYVGGDGVHSGPTGYKARAAAFTAAAKG